MPISTGTALLGAGALSAGASIFGATSQASAEQKAIAAQQQMLSQGLSWAGQEQTAAQGALNPFISAGQGAMSTYQAALPGLTKPFSAAALPTTPGYEFALSQGLRSTQNQFAAQGLGSSGSALKGAGAYATNLAQGTYNQQFQNYLAQNAQIGNLLYQPAATGAGAASTLGGIEGQLGTAGLSGAVSTGQGIASSMAGYGNALAGGAAGVAGAAQGGLNSYLQLNLLNQLLAGKTGSAATSASAAPAATSPNLLSGQTLSFGIPGLGSTAYNPFSG